MSTTPTGSLDTRQEVLAAEHAAVHLYGILGARTSESGDPVLSAFLREAWSDHRDLRDALTAALLDAGVQPVPAAPGYRVPDLSTRARLRAAAGRIERACASAYAAMVSHTTGRERAWAIDALAASARREQQAGTDPGAFPGLPEMGG